MFYLQLETFSNFYFNAYYNYGTLQSTAIDARYNAERINISVLLYVKHTQHALFLLCFMAPTTAGSPEKISQPINSKHTTYHHPALFALPLPAKT